MRHIAHIFHHQFIFTDMKIQIRQGVFETNSSSVHTLSISKSKSKFSKIKDSITKIERCLKSVGISCEFEFDENYDYYWYCDSRDVFDELFAEDDKTFTILLLNYIYDKNQFKKDTTL